jgi:preprotein translocase subunit Sss1
MPLALTVSLVVLGAVIVVGVVGYLIDKSAEPEDH